MSSAPRSGEAGKRGANVRSDCWIGVEPAPKGGLQITLQSKVAGMYGDRIESLIREGCRTMGLADAKITVEDQGALPFTLAARLETAVLRAGHQPAAPFLLPTKPHCRYPARADRLRRSRLYLPGNEPKFYANAGLHRPDGVILDLEDCGRSERKGRGPQPGARRPCARSISTAASAWCGSTRARWAWRIWTGSSPTTSTWC